MKTYHSLSKIKFLNKYSYKFLFIAFLGIHVPLLGILFYTLFVSEVTTLTIILIILGLTLGATALTLLMLNNLLSPIIKGKIALSEFVENNTVPQLPINYSDEVGEVLKNIQLTIENLDAVNKEKEEVTELISHDLKTPVHQSLSVLQLLRDEVEDPVKSIEYIDILENIITKQKDFLEDMIKMLKSKNVEMSAVNFERFQISELIKMVISSQAVNIENKNLKVENKVPTKIYTIGHVQAFKKVISNLLNNAIKFSKAGGNIVFEGEQKDNTIILKTRDFGTGFTEKTKEIMFRKFIPGHLGTEGEPSIGLGLHISQSIVKKHGGTIKAQSEGKDQGATMTIMLPAYP